ncbi:MAG TPA: hypothetical protein DDZ51_31180 [Planctomycetaceae bacterium]|nr:hypothetical protein [Planctomycetaceae bacterium]
MIGNTRNRELTLLRTHLKYLSKCKYILWRLGWTRPEIWVALKSSNVKIALRRGTHDAHIAREVFAEGQYNFANLKKRAESVRCIIDVGANVGYSIVYFAMNFPLADIYAYEPIPEHLEQIRKHIEENGLANRVHISPCAAGAESRQSWMFLDGAGSCLLDNKNDNAQEIRVVDWYQTLPGGEIELIKMDIEGAEVELLRDSRFLRLADRTNMIALEWHAAANVSQPREWCIARLQESGFAVEEGCVQYEIAGTLVGTKKQTVIRN